MTLDALHTCHQTARCVVEHCGAHYVMTAVKDNCPNLLAELAGLDWELAQVRATEHPDAGPRTRDTDESRSEAARVLDLTEHRDRASPASSSGRLSHRARAAHRENRRGRARDRARPDLTAPRPGQVVLALVRGHWSIENRLHHVRDVSYDEDRCRVRTGHLPRNLACLTNLAISIVRLKGRFDSIPQAHRHYARRPQDAVRQLINPPNR